MLNNWIDVADELPEFHIPVLAWIGRDNPDYAHGCTVGYYEEMQVRIRYPELSGWQTETKRRWYDVYNYDLNNVIAWQPLPFGPNGEAVVSANLIRAKTDVD